MHKRSISMSLISMCILAVTLISCSDDDCLTCPDDGNAPLFTVAVVDTLGNPVEGLRVGRFNHTYHTQTIEKMKAPPLSSLRWLVVSPFKGYLIFRIYDYGDNLFVNVVEPWSVDYHTTCQISWWPSDSLGQDLRDGFYYGYFKFTSVAEPVSVVEIIAPDVLEPNPDPVISTNFLGFTGPDGVFTTDDTLYFPYLLGNKPTVYVKDEAGMPLDTLIYYTDTVTIVLSDTANPSAFLYSDRLLTAGENHFEVVWDPKLAE